MAFIKVAIFVLASLLLVSARESPKHEENFMQQEVVTAYPPVSPAPAPAAAPHFVKDVKECKDLCTGRCIHNSRPKICNRACNSCCFECKCVPPGTYGNREVCGVCYTERLTHRNETKCP